METLTLTAIGVMATIVLSALGLWRKGQADWRDELESQVERLQKEIRVLKEENTAYEKRTGEQQRTLYRLYEEIHDLERKKGDL